MTPQDQNDPTLVATQDPALAAQAAQNSDPGFFQRLMRDGVLGMPVSEALLRFGSGLLSGNGWSEGLSRAGASLVQGAQTAQNRQLQQALADRRFQEARLLQNDRIAAQERIAGLRQGAGRFPNQPDMAVDPETGTRYTRAWDTQEGTQIIRAPDGTVVTDPGIIGRLRWSRGMDTGNNQNLRAETEAWTQFAGLTERARDAAGLVPILRSLADAPASGPDLLQRFGEFASRFGINIPNLGPNPTLRQLREFWFSEANQSAFRQRIAGLQPISNVDLNQALRGLLDERSTPEAVRSAADRLERDSNIILSDWQAAQERFGDPARRRYLFEAGEFTPWLASRRAEQAAQRANSPNPPFTTQPGNPSAEPQRRPNAALRVDSRGNIITAPQAAPTASQGEPPPPAEPAAPAPAGTAVLRPSADAMIRNLREGRTVPAPFTRQWQTMTPEERRALLRRQAQGQ